MDRYIDLNIVADAKIGRFDQPALSTGDTGILVSPVMDGVDIEDVPAKVTSYVISGAGSSGVNGTYVLQEGLVLDGNITNIYAREGGSYAMYPLPTDDTNGAFWEDAKKGDWVIRYYYTGVGFGSPYYGGVSPVDGASADRATWRTTQGIGTTPVPTVALGAATQEVAGVGLKYDPISGKWMYSDGTEWKEFGASSSGSVIGDLIPFTSADLDTGILTIQHNLGTKYVLGLDYSITPKDVLFVDENTLKLDYSDQSNNGSLSGSVWFVGSKQGTIVSPAQ